MEPKGTIDSHSITPTFPYDGEVKFKSIEDLDCIALVKLCANDPNNSAAWHEFLSRFIGRIRIFVFRASQWERTGNSSGSFQSPTAYQQDLEDLVQEVLVRLIANDCLLLKRLEGETEDSLCRYLSVISTSVVMNRYKYLRRQRRLQHNSRLEEVDQALLDRIGLNREDLKIEKSILMQEIVQIVEDFLREEIAEAEIRDRYLLIFKLYLFEGLSLSEISRYCGINLSRHAVDKIIVKIIRRLKERLRCRGEEK